MPTHLPTLTPTTIFHLLANKEITSTSHPFTIGVGLSHERQTFQSELSGVGMTYTPRSVPDTFWCLAIVEELDGAVGYISVTQRERKGNSNNEYIVQ